MARGFQDDYPSLVIDVLADQLEQDTGCTIDRDALWGDMRVFDLQYQLHRSAAQLWSPEGAEAVQRVSQRCQEFQVALQDAAEILPQATGVQAILQDLNRMEEFLTWQAEAVHREKNARPTKTVLFENSINHLAMIYESHTDRPAGTSATEDGRGGPFVRFVENVLETADPDHGRAALGESIAKILPTLKGKRGPRNVMFQAFGARRWKSSAN